MPRTANDTPLTAEQRELADRCAAYALGYSSNLQRRYPYDADGVHDAVMAGMIEAVRTFDPYGPVPIGAWLTWVVKHRLTDRARKVLRRHARYVTAFDFKDVPDLLDSWEDESEVLLDTLPYYAADITRRRVIRDESFVSISARYGLHRLAVYRVVTHALKSLRVHAEALFRS